MITFIIIAIRKWIVVCHNITRIIVTYSLEDENYRINFHEKNTKNYKTNFSLDGLFFSLSMR